jgi:hypothetical protein
MDDAFAGTMAGRQAERERSRRLFDSIAMQKLLARALCRRIGEIADRRQSQK